MVLFSLITFLSFNNAASVVTIVWTRIRAQWGSGVHIMIYVFKISNEQMASSVFKGLQAGYLQYAAKRIQGMTNDTKNNGQAK